MRHLVVSLLLFCTAIGSKAAADDDPNFFYAVSFSSGMQVTRYAKPEYAATLQKDRPHCVLVTWAYEGEIPGPDGELKRELDLASKAVGTGAGAASDSEVVVTSLSANTGVWVVYTGSGKEVATEINRLLHGLTKSRFKVRLTRDPEWSVLAKFVAEFQAKQ